MAKTHIDTELFDRAVKFAVDAHSGIERKGKAFPYIIHPLEAAAIVATITNDQEILAATVLHDVVEDTDRTIEDIREAFGDRVAELVDSESEIRTPGQSASESWYERKAQAINRLSFATHDAKIVAMGDKLSNMRAIARDYHAMGDEVWKIFNVKDKALHEWHYKGLRDALAELSDTDAYIEFNYLIKATFETNYTL